jgi:hypothetical protein
MMDEPERKNTWREILGMAETKKEKAYYVYEKFAIDVVNQQFLPP